MAKPIITAERLRELLHYDPDTGVFTWKVKRKGLKNAIGKIAGSKNQTGYICIGVNGFNYLAHRLAWLYMTGETPTLPMDHINGKRHDNRWLNIRHVDWATNAQNQRKACRSNKSSGMLGVSLYKRTGRWQAQIVLNGRKTALGYFDTPEAAHTAYLEVKRSFHPGCTI